MYPGISLVVMPLSLLMEEQRDFTHGRLGARYFVLVQDTNSKQNLQDIAHSLFTHSKVYSPYRTSTDIQVVFTSPEMLQKKEFRTTVLGSSRFLNRLVCVTIDEAHLCCDWQPFCPEYGQIYQLRDLLPIRIPFLAVTATLSKRTRRIMSKYCGLQKGETTIRTSTDRPEIYIRIHRLLHKESSQHDLVFLLPTTRLVPRDSQNDYILPKQTAHPGCT